MRDKAMNILVIEDDVEACEKLMKCAEQRKDIKIVGTTDSDIEALKYCKLKHPNGIILDIELNNGVSGNTNALDFLKELKAMNLNYEPIIIVTTHINSKKTYDILHRNGADLIIYKDHPKYSPNHVFNCFINFQKEDIEGRIINNALIGNNEEKISNLINAELDFIGISPKLKGRKYIYDGIKYILENEKNQASVIQYLTNKYKKSGTTITNGIQNSIIHAWRITPIEDLEKYYTARINYETGIPTPMEFLYYYVNKIKKEI